MWLHYCTSLLIRLDLYLLCNYEAISCLQNNKANQLDELLFRLRAASKFARILNRTKKYQSFMSYVLAHCIEHCRYETWRLIAVPGKIFYNAVAVSLPTIYSSTAHVRHELIWNVVNIYIQPAVYIVSSLSRFRSILCKLPQWGPGETPCSRASANTFWCILSSQIAPGSNIF